LVGTRRSHDCTCQCPVLNSKLHIGGWDSAQTLWLPEPQSMMLLDVMTAPQHTKLTHQQQANQSSTAMSIAGRGLPATSLAGHPNTAGQHIHHRCLHLYPPPAQQPCEPLGLIMTSQQPLATHSLTSCHHSSLWQHTASHHAITAACGNTQPHIMTSQQPLATHSLTS